MRERREIPAATGDCYEAAVKLMLSRFGRNDNLRVVHGYVSGQGELDGIRFDHAWVEDVETDTVLDYSNGRRLEIPRFVYYALGRIFDEETFRYDFAAVKRKITDIGTYGAWDLEPKTEVMY